jgi:GNAT superfamily N-acetyltransferase
MDVRLLAPADVARAAAVSVDALGAGPAGDTPAQLRTRMGDRIEHLRRTDPAGAWVAEDDGEIVGVAQALVRDGVWGLSLLSVTPRLQARGIGRRLLAAALRCADGTRGQLIMSSVDPKAMRVYAQAGFALLPGVAAAGIPRGVAMPEGVATSSPEDAAEVARTAGRAVRGAGYDAGDLAMLESRGARILTLGDRGIAAHRDGSPRLIAATDEEAATLLLRGCLADAPRGGTVGVEPLIAGNDWAIRTCLDAGLALSPDGPLFTRGVVGRMSPWIPSGALL